MKRLFLVMFFLCASIARAAVLHVVLNDAWVGEGGSGQALYLYITNDSQKEVSVAKNGLWAKYYSDRNQVEAHLSPPAKYEGRELIQGSADLNIAVLRPTETVLVILPLREQLTKDVGFKLVIPAYYTERYGVLSGTFESKVQVR